MNTIVLSGRLLATPEIIQINNDNFYKFTLVNDYGSFSCVNKSMPNFNVYDNIYVRGELESFTNLKNQKSLYINTDVITSTDEQINIINISGNIEHQSNICGQINLVKIKTDNNLTIYAESMQFSLKYKKCEVIGDLQPTTLDVFGFMNYTIVAEKIR